jgi:PAS domain S-box-containing protein
VAHGESTERGEIPPGAPPGRPLRVLLVEDSEDDASLILRELRSGGYVPTADRVDTAAGLAAALHHRWDLVLCDCVLPAFSGAEALAQIRVREPRLPVIIVSGYNDAAADVMRAGADAFVSKRRLSGLLPAVLREQPNEPDAGAPAPSAAELARRWQLLFRQAPVGILLTDAAGQVTSANPVLLALLGSPSEEASRRFNVLALEPLYQHGIRDAFARVLAGGPLEHLEAPYQSVWGTQIDLSMQVVGLRGADGAVCGSLAIIQDETDKVRTLAAYDRAARHLHETVTALASSREELGALLNSLECIVWEADADTFTFTFVSEQGERQLGYPLDEWTAPGFFESHVHPDDRNAVLRDCRAAVDRGENHTLEYRMRAADGRWLWMRDLVTVVTEGGKPTRLRGFLLDVTAQRDHAAAIERLNRELEHRVQERTRELEFANRELEAFSYSVSHDLRAPLRAVGGFARIVREENEAVLAPDALAKLDRVITAASRMETLIDSLFDLSRLARGQVHRSSVDLSATARQVAAELQQAEPGRVVHVTITDDLHASADPALVHVLIENLLGNAWKYTRPRGTAAVAFGRNGRDVFFVRDNGVGFDMTYAKRLFTPFQRLHNAAEFEGTGVGLATVQRIVQRHGGRVWVESAPDAGATFYFTLEPAKTPGQS